MNKVYVESEGAIRVITDSYTKLESDMLFVAKVEGKGLSTNDLTNEISLLDGGNSSLRRWLRLTLNKSSVGLVCTYTCMCNLCVCNSCARAYVTCVHIT